MTTWWVAVPTSLQLVELASFVESKEQKGLVVKPPSSALAVAAASCAIYSQWYRANSVWNLGQKAPFWAIEKLVMEPELVKSSSTPCFDE